MRTRHPLIEGESNKSSILLQFKGVTGALSPWEKAEVIQGFVVSPVCLTIDHL
jgi:hypothetical protein